ncbi:MAG: hypothetical protein IJJ42_07625 [Clostridia bacterium]|nr:hypothetical protein [Clostridia bacterium]
MSYELKSARWLAADILRQVLSEGDEAVDATMGNGHDTEALCRLVGPSGHVYAFDIQAQAVGKTGQRLTDAGLADRASLFHTGHEHMREKVPHAVRLVMFNLGWLPGSDHLITTRLQTTLAAVEQGLELLLPGGVLLICVYPGHEEGAREQEALIRYLSSLPPQRFNVLRQTFLNAGPGAPECLVVQKAFA